jgi:hypothetical protein
MVTFSCTNDNNTAADTANTTEVTDVDASADEQQERTPSTVDTIHVDTYNTWKTNWANHGATWMASNTLTAFNLPKVDLSNILLEHPDSSRFYLGLEDTGGGVYTPKLMVVGVSAGRDMIDYANGKYVYDVSSACPPYCGK